MPQEHNTEQVKQAEWAACCRHQENQSTHVLPQDHLETLGPVPTNRAPAGRSRPCAHEHPTLTLSDLFLGLRSPHRAPAGRSARSASSVSVSAMPVASGSTVLAPRSPRPASASASATSRFASCASSEDPAAWPQQPPPSQGFFSAPTSDLINDVTKVTKATVGLIEVNKGKCVLTSLVNGRQSGWHKNSRGGTVCPENNMEVTRRANHALGCSALTSPERPMP